MTRFAIPQWFDAHAHLRQGENLKHFINAHRMSGCASIVAMPNTKPVVSRVLGNASPKFWTVESYTKLIEYHGGDDFLELIVPLYLTAGTTPAMIYEGADDGLLKACKYYPPHGTTNSGSAAPIATYIDNGVFAAMEKRGIILCVHGEMHGLPDEQWFNWQSNAEEQFYQQVMPEIRKRFPRLKIMAEHISTAVAVAWVQSQDPRYVRATVCPQHLLLNASNVYKHMLLGAYCQPVPKWEEDQWALVKAVTEPGQKHFCAGTDSAPHTDDMKLTLCGCASGCYTGNCAPQLYAQVFEEAGYSLADNVNQRTFAAFMVYNGSEFYNIMVASSSIILESKPSTVSVLNVSGRKQVTPLPVAMKKGAHSAQLEWSIELAA